MRRLLITGFGPFGEHDFNTSGAGVEILRSKYAKGEAPEGCYSVLPVQWILGLETLRTLVKNYQPTAVLMFGVGGGCQLTIERFAYNETSLPGQIPEKDVLGYRPPTGVLIEGSNPVCRTPISPEALAGRLRIRGIPVGISEDPGRYLCNAVYHCALAELKLPAMFIHVARTSSMGWDQIPDHRVFDWIEDAVSSFHEVLDRNDLNNSLVPVSAKGQL